MSLAPSAAEDQLDRTIRHIVASIEAAPEHAEPFRHLQLEGVFPPQLYAAMLEAMPGTGHYRRMSGRARSNQTADGAATRTKIDLFPEFIRNLPSAEQRVWRVVGRALCSAPVREAFRARLAAGLEKRFGAGFRDVGMYPIPILTRDVPGYRIGVHPDTRRKGMTIQLYLPRDRSIEHVGTVFHRRTGHKQYEVGQRMAFAPNTGYAFAVGEDTYHSVPTVGPEVTTRDSILLTYFVDDTLPQVIYNRGKRLGNSVLSVVRGIAR
jgi:hypothetical protein